MSPQQAVEETAAAAAAAPKPRAADVAAPAPKPPPPVPPPQESQLDAVLRSIGALDAKLEGLAAEVRDLRREHLTG